MDPRLNRILRVLRGNFERVSRPGKMSAEVDDLLHFIRESTLGVCGATGTLTTETILRLYCIATDWLLYLLLRPMIDDDNWPTKSDTTNRNIETGLAALGVSSAEVVTTNILRDWNHSIFVNIGAFPSGLLGQAIQMYDNRVMPTSTTLYCTTDPNTYVLAGPKPSGTELVIMEDVSGYVRVVTPAVRVAPAADNAGQAGIVPVEGRFNLSVNDIIYSSGIWQPFTGGLNIKTIADTPETLFISIRLSTCPATFYANSNSQFVSLPSTDSPMPASIAPGNPSAHTSLGRLSTIALNAFGVTAYSYISSTTQQRQIETYSEIVNLAFRMA